MGYRALRLALGREGLMKVQARALLDAAAGKTLNVMFPMVSEPWEFEAARQIVEDQRRHLIDRGADVPAQVNYGAMLEVPALAEVLDTLLPMVDFLSIGTNDLVQFLFASDRSHPKLAERYDWLSLSVLRFLKRVVDAADEANVPVTVCGEMGGRPAAAMALLALGYRRLSITPAGIGPVKAMIRTLDLADLTEAMQGWMAAGRNIRAALEGWVEMHGTVIPGR